MFATIDCACYMGNQKIKYIEIPVEPRGLDETWQLLSRLFLSTGVEREAGILRTGAGIKSL